MSAFMEMWKWDKLVQNKTCPSGLPWRLICTWMDGFLGNIVAVSFLGSGVHQLINTGFGYSLGPQEMVQEGIRANVCSVAQMVLGMALETS